MNRTEKRIFKINDQLAAIRRELATTTAELEYHRSINDDAQRDAVVGNSIDREEASLTRGDVRRFEKTIVKLQDRQTKLLALRADLLARLPD